MKNAVTTPSKRIIHTFTTVIEGFSCEITQYEEKSRSCDPRCGNYWSKNTGIIIFTPNNPNTKSTGLSTGGFVKPQFIFDMARKSFANTKWAVI